ncbi:MAG: FAD-containing oxidoreductase, partial [Planctomycetaceae bacterium]|nr:FAD-containing oxidoreductase [Planctomycetaceae bacterium]
SPYRFTHAADALSRAALQNAVFAVGPLGRVNTSRLIIPWATYTSPEVARVGLSERDAADAGIEIDVYLQPLEGVDRAVLDGCHNGFVKILTHRGTDRIAGAAIVAEHADELISLIASAMTNRIGLRRLASVICPYPTLSEAVRKAGDQYNRTRLTRISRAVLSILR